MPWLLFPGVAAICLVASISYSDPLEDTFGPDKQRGYRPERFSDRPPSAGDTFSRRDVSDFSSQRRHGVWSRWYYQKLHNLMPEE
jgi:hypothetical protein